MSYFFLVLVEITYHQCIMKFIFLPCSIGCVIWKLFGHSKTVRIWHLSNNVTGHRVAHDTEWPASILTRQNISIHQLQRVTMPPIRTGNAQNSSNQEGRILLAISDLKNGKIQSVHQAEQIYNVPHITLQHRLAGIEYWAEKHTNSHKLTQHEEESLLKWVFNLDKYRLPSRLSLIQDIANLLFSQYRNEHVNQK